MVMMYTNTNKKSVYLLEKINYNIDNVTKIIKFQYFKNQQF